MSRTDKALYDKIRRDNKEKYGTAVEVYGPVLLANLYSDRTHFVYELLQNAEDACERAKQATGKTKYTCTIQLGHDQLLMRHNGIPFGDQDVIGICGIVEGTKTDDRSQIGKFGIGFKSVYAYTRSPEIHSGGKSFCIRNYVQPFAIDPDEKIEEHETVVVIPFDHDSVTSKVAHGEISGRLADLGVTTLLFLVNIEEVGWSIEGGRRGWYRRSSHCVDDNVRKVHLSSCIGNSSQAEEWLVFERAVTENGTSKVEVAFKIETADDKKEIIVPVTGAKLASFFLTEKVTWLNFIVQGPYKTTPARDNVSFVDEWNRMLLTETARLVADAIPMVKKMGLLDVSFLDTLPINKRSLLTVNPVMSPLFHETRATLASSQALLPADDHDYVSREHALLARGKDLTELLSRDQLEELFGRTTWLDTSITKDRYPQVREYLMEELRIPEIEPEQLGRALTDSFMLSQSDEWMRQLYSLLQKQPALWRERGLNQQEGIFRSKPIVRLTDGTHTRPFDDKGNPLAFLPPAEGRKTRFPTVKPVLVKDEQSRRFLLSLGLREPDMIDEVVRLILPKYRQANPSIGGAENLEDVEAVCLAIRAYGAPDGQSRNKDLLQEVRATGLLLATNCGDGKRGFRKPGEVYIGQFFTGNSDVDLYFAGNPSIWMLDQCYTEVVKSFGLDAMVKLGCKSIVAVRHRPADSSGSVTIRSWHGNHERGLGGFDPDCELDGLGYALQSITVEKARIVWETLKRNAQSVSGVVEKSTRQDYSHSTRQTVFSKIGRLLTEHAWLPTQGSDTEPVFRKPSEVSLGELPPSFDPGSPESKLIGQKLKFRLPVEQQLMEQLSDEDREIYRAIRNLDQEERKQIMEVLNQIKNSRAVSGGPRSASEIGNQFRESLECPARDPVDGNDSRAYSGVSPEEEQTIRKEYGERFADNLKKMRVTVRTKVVKDSQVLHSIGPKDFLLEQYQGHCQICNTCLDLGPGKKPYFETFRLVETQARHGWTDMEFNVICLCPNCHALLKHGDSSLTSIVDVAEQAGASLIAPQPVRERRGDHYIIRIRVADTEREIFYTPTHMAKLSAFIQEADKPQA